MKAHISTFSDRQSSELDHPWLAWLLEALDTRLRRRHAVREYTNARDCVFRMQVTESNNDFVLSDGTRVDAGERVINLHLWSEQIPRFPKPGPTLAWARYMSRAVDGSLHKLVLALKSRPELDDVAVICVTVSLGSAERHRQIARFSARYGFERVVVNQSRSAAELVHQFGENILISLVVFARNSAALRADTLWRDRTLLVVLRRNLEEYFGCTRQTNDCVVERP